MARIYKTAYKAKSGVLYTMSFYRDPYMLGLAYTFEIHAKHKSFQYSLGLESGVLTLPEMKITEPEEVRRHFIRMAIHEMKEELDKGHEKNIEHIYTLHDFKHQHSLMDLFRKYPKLCSFRKDTPEGHLCLAAEEGDEARGLTTFRLCELCPVPEDYERCKYMRPITHGRSMGDEWEIERIVKGYFCTKKGITLQDIEEEKKLCPEGDYSPFVMS